LNNDDIKWYDEVVHIINIHMELDILVDPEHLKLGPIAFVLGAMTYDPTCRHSDIGVGVIKE